MICQDPRASVLALLAGIGHQLEEVCQLSNTLVRGLDSGLQHHLHQFLRVSLPCQDRVAQLRAEAVVRNVLLVAAHLAVLGHHLRLHQLQT